MIELSPNVFKKSILLAVTKKISKLYAYTACFGNFVYRMFHSLHMSSCVKITKGKFGFHASVQMEVLNK